MNLKEIFFKVDGVDYTIKLDTPIYAEPFDYSSMKKQAREIVGNYMRENGIEGNPEIAFVDSILF